MTDSTDPAKHPAGGDYEERARFRDAILQEKHDELFRKLQELEHIPSTTIIWLLGGAKQQLKHFDDHFRREITQDIHVITQKLLDKECLPEKRSPS